jgi:hypothetical protein
MEIKLKSIYICWNMNNSAFKTHSNKFNKDDLIININSNHGELIDSKFQIINITNNNPDQTVKDISTYLDITKYDKWEPLNTDIIDGKDANDARMIFRKIAEITNAKIMQRNTLLTRSILFIKNFFENVKSLDGQLSLKDFHNRFNNRPFLIVAAGPSLDKQLEALKKYQHFFYIIAVDKAYPSLYKNNITPDVVITIDPLSIASWGQDQLSDSTLFITDIGSSPAIIQSNNKNHLFISSNHELHGIAQYFGIPSDLLETGGSVATSAFSFAYICGANPIAFIGQDLAFTNNKDHASDYINSYSEDLIKSKIKGGFTTDGYYGDQIQTDKQLLMYKYWFEGKFKLIKDRYIFNCTEGGANIKGALNIPFQILCNEISKDIPTKIPMLKFRIENQQDAIHLENFNISINKAIKDLQKALDGCNKAVDFNNKNKQHRLTKSKIDVAIKLVKNLDYPLKALSSNFNQIELYSTNISISRAEEKSNSDLNSHYDKFLKSTARAINSTIEFLENAKLK